MKPPTTPATVARSVSSHPINLHPFRKPELFALPLQERNAPLPHYNSPNPGVTPSRKLYPTDVSDEEWSFIVPYPTLPQGHRGADRTIAHNLTESIE